MLVLLDTSVAIPLRDGDERTIERLASLDAVRLISVLTRVELEGGIHRDKEEAPELRLRVNLLLQEVEELPFTSAEAVAYGRIVEALGFSRPRVIDRMIAATALCAQVPLITSNPRDFRDIPNLRIEDWS